MKNLFTILTLLIGIYFLLFPNSTYCNAEDFSVNATITNREAKSQDVNDIRLRFIKNNWVNVPPQVLKHFYLGIRYADSGSTEFSEILFFPLKEIKEIDFKDEFATGDIIRKRDGSYIDIKRDKVTGRETISFYAAGGNLISSKAIDYYKFMPSENAHPDWVIFRCEGLISDNNKEMKKYNIEIPQEVRKIVFH
jgi:hypothetical protein